MAVERRYLRLLEEAYPGEIQRRYDDISAANAQRMDQCLVSLGGGFSNPNPSRKSYFQPNGDMVTIVRQPSGYARFRLRALPGEGRGKMVAAHTLALAARVLGQNGAFPPNWEDAAFQTSHLCNEPRCMERTHVVLEEAGFQTTRDVCSFFALGTAHVCPHARVGAEACVLWRPWDAPSVPLGPGAHPPGEFADRVVAGGL